MIEIVKTNHENSRKVYIPVWAYYTASGQIRPLAMRLGEETIKVKKVIDVRPRASRKIGGAGIRYLCTVEDEYIRSKGLKAKKMELYLEGKRWFIEA